jgi:hypothetical protein
VKFFWVGTKHPLNLQLYFGLLALRLLSEISGKEQRFSTNATEISGSIGYFQFLLEFPANAMEISAGSRKFNG